MKVLYFIVCLLLVACSGDNQPEVNQPFELKNIIVGDQQNQQTFENVAPNVAIVLEFSDAVDEASARNNIALKHEELPVSCDYEFLQEKKVSVTPKGGFKVLSSYKLIVNPGVKSTSGTLLSNGKVCMIKTGMDDTDKFERIPDEDLLHWYRSRPLSTSGTLGMNIPEWRANVLLRAMSLLPVVPALA